MNRPSDVAVALVTSEAHPALTPDDQYLSEALAAGGFRPVACRWDEPDNGWGEYAAVVVRSCWDYHYRITEFLAWLDQLEACGAQVVNPVSTIRWNARKTYLRDLAERGIGTVPTAWVSQGDTVSLAQVMHQHDWRSVVIKPIVSAAAFDTWRAGPELTDADEQRFARAASTGDIMVQPYLAEIESDGELSFVFLNGRFSHAVLKRPRAGDFRVQTDFGGSVELVRPPEDLVTQAAHVLEAAPAPCLYARVDACVVARRLLLMELELIEPELFFRTEPRAAARFTEELRRMLEQLPDTRLEPTSHGP